MKLEVGMYVRTKRDGIGRIISLSIGEEDECCFIELSNRRTGIKEHNIVKASHKIEELLQIGDYINGSKVNFVEEGFIYWETGNAIHPEYIETVLTKEQFESMAYKVV